MKWLLISNTENANPGDEWIRIGVQRLIRDVDPHPEFIIRNKELIEDQEPEVEFDKAVWCGSPLFWSHSGQGCWENHWWLKWVNGWLFKEKNKVLILAVGDVVGKTLHDEVQYYTSIRFVKEKCWELWTRNPVSRDKEIQVCCCPSVFALNGFSGTQSKRLCNLMPDGAHDSIMDEKEASIWKEKVGRFSGFLMGLDFEFVSHALFEEEFAQSLGWPNNRLHRRPKVAEDYFPIYSKASMFIGNRIHGAMLTVGAGGKALAIGYDSRLGMASYVGASVMRPSELSESAVLKWIEAPHKPYDWHPEYDKQIVLLRRFAEA